MKLNSLNFNLETEFVKIETDDNWLNNLRIAGKCLKEVMQLVKTAALTQPNISLLDLDKIGEEEIQKRNCIPTFKEYKGFPGNLCLSVNRQLVHGIPTNYQLKDGDILSIDFGTTFDGAITDAAETIIIGEAKSNMHKKMIETAKKCLSNAIGSIKIGNRIGTIGDIVYKTARNSGFNVITNYGGHGILKNMPHAQPFISNKSNPVKGVRIQSGMVFAIEPLLVPLTCSTDTVLDKDGWTVLTKDVSCHEEHTLYIGDDGSVEVLTK